MSAIILDAFKIRTLDLFLNSLATNSLYLAIGRPYYWDTISSLDSTIPVPVNTVKNQSQDWEDVLSLKKLATTDTNHGIFKETWQPNIKYDTYRHDWDGSIVSSYTGFNTHITTPSSIGDVKCTVITSNYNIYICLKQQIVLGEIQPSIYSPDTGVPVGTNTTIVKTADGYYWKFLGTTSTSDVIKFSSKFYHPIQTIPSAPGGGDPYLPQWNAQVYSANFKGGIYVINVTAAGSGYNGGSAGTHTESDPQLKIIGDGTGLQFTVTYGTGGSISDIEITNPGTGYTYASVVTTGGTNAAFDIIFTPMSGLGVNPVYNVCARFLLVSTALVGDEGGKFTTTNDYRKVSLVYNPTNFGTSTVATSATLDASTTLVVQTGLPSGAYLVDAIVTGATSGAKGRVVDFNPSTGHVRVIRTGSENIGSTGANVSFQVSETLNTTPGTGTGVIASIISPDVQIYSGDIVYTEYRAPINRDPSQTENISVIAKF